IRAGQVVVDLGTSSVSQTRDFAKQLQAKGASWADAPIARTRQAAQDGTLSVMVGATPALHAAIEPLIRCFATDVTHCGDVRAGQVVVDLGTSSVSQTRDFAKQLQAKGAAWADAPIARTRQAAQDGTLSVMVGASPELYAAIEPLIRCFATDVSHCGDVGAGQVTKILNNMVLFQTVNALAEAVAVARRSGVDPALLLDTLSKGSADSFALRNHGIKAIVPGNFPERAFSTEYALKDLSYALELAADAGIKIRGAELIGKVLQEAVDAGSGAAYFPVIAKHIDGA